MTKNNKAKSRLTFPCLVRRGNLNNSSCKNSCAMQGKQELRTYNCGLLQGKGRCSWLLQAATVKYSLGRPYSSLQASHMKLCKVNTDLILDTINRQNHHCFSVSVYRSPKVLLTEGVSLIFYISLKDEKLIKSISQALLGCGQITKRKDSFIFRVKDLLSILEVVIPFFNKHSLQGRKLVAFQC